jgi:hypothetical protein
MLCYIKWDMFVNIEDAKIFEAFLRHKNLEDKFASHLFGLHVP